MNLEHIIGETGFELELREVYEIFAGRCAGCCCGECGRALSPMSCAQAHPPLSYALCSQHVCTLLKLNKSIAEIESTRAPDHSALNDCWQVLDTGKRLTVGKCTASAPSSTRLSVCHGAHTVEKKA